MKELSKEILEKAGIYVEQDPYEECGYKILRYGIKAGRTKQKTWQKLNPCLNARYHKYSGKMNWYWLVGYSENGEPKAYPLHRLVYAWFIGNVPGNMDVDHIDGDTLNNNLSNLQLLSRAENLAKRKGFKNQWDSKKANEEVTEIAKDVNEETGEVTIKFSDGSKMTFSGMNNESTLTESQTKLVSRLEEAAAEDNLPDLKAGLENLSESIF